MAHYALQKLHILPSVLNNMDDREKAIVYASILTKMKADKEEADRIKKASNKK